MIRICAVLLWVALVSLVSMLYEAVKTWLLVRPVRRFKSWRARRRLAKTSWAEHHLDEIAENFNSPDEERRSMAVNTGLRSSSNMVIAGGVTNIIIEVVQMFWPEFVLSPEMRVNLTLAIAWVASRFTKTPASPGAV